MEIKLSQFCSMMLMIMLSCLLGILGSSCINLAGVDCWMVPIIGFILGIPILLIYLYIYNHEKTLNLNELIIKLFGAITGKILASILLFFAITFTMITFWNLTNFVASQYLYNTPQWFIDILFIITTYYFFSKNENTIFRASLVLTFLAAILYGISFIGLMDKINLNNLKPVLENGILPILKASFNYITYAILPIFTLSIIPKNKIDTNKLNKGIIITYIIGNIIIFVCLFVLISIFGINLANLYQYPGYHILKRVFIGGFIERLENVLSIQWIIILFIPCAFCNFYSLNSIKNIFNIKKNKYIYPLLMLLMFFSQYIFKNNTLGENFLIYIYPVFMSIILIGIPLIIFIRILTIKKSKT